ncbi:glycerol-3-phosphate-binding periplasmic protein precursor [Legionella feeleii]|uniref:sn-glycerol-3-phosphate-binding periplasmic protein UgpB n=2 Tax=Legionella feeleii TaxID=453 RepID=A0A0W0U1A1_9GAMM|nr:glycerol-3-phosphate-binding periplasmic protein precursor [Legionella feeleii]SPX61239.1 glycerol-3-phosphate-binding periplasmic protein precursor [Legionella feeleii]
MLILRSIFCCPARKAVRCKRRFLSLFFALFFLIPFSSSAKTEIVMWHSLAGHLGAEVKRLATNFNHSQNDYTVKLVYKGEYIEAITSFAAAFRAKQPPAIVQIFEVGTATMLYPPGIIKPVGELMQEQGFNLPEDHFLPALRAFYSEANSLLAMPFNTSIPVIYYNADALAKAGYSVFPDTWEEMEVLAAALRKAGYACAYTTAYPAWVQIESFSAIHGLPMLDAERAVVSYNNPAIIRHLERLKEWQQKHYFEYGGRTSDATVLFTSGRCPLFSQSSGAYNSLSELVRFRLGVAALPLDKQVSSRRYNNVTGGAALWAVAGQKADVYRGIAAFFAYIAQPKVQQHWHQETGYLPLGISGVYAGLAQESQHPVLRLAQADLMGQQAKEARVNFGPQNQIRAINDEALEAIFSGMKTPAEAVREAEKHANYALMRFVRITKE